MERVFPQWRMFRDRGVWRAAEDGLPEPPR